MTICYLNAALSVVATATPEATTSIEDAFDRLEKGEDVVLACKPKELLKYLFSRYIRVKAAGGIVEQGCKRLIIHREGCWDIPKGMVEPGETLKQAALREVEEETGVEAELIDSRPVKSYHIYNKYGGWHLKQTSWFRMKANSVTTLRPQKEEGIDQCLWMEQEEWREKIAHSFRSFQQIKF